MNQAELEKELEDWKPNCYCKKGEKFCGDCVECGKPGHTQHCPLPIPFTASWCDDCAKKMMRMDHAGKSPEEIFKALEEENKNHNP